MISYLLLAQNVFFQQLKHCLKKEFEGFESMFVSLGILPLLTELD